MGKANLNEDGDGSENNKLLRTTSLSLVEEGWLLVRDCVTTQTRESWSALGNGNYYYPKPVASLKNKNSNKTQSWKYQLIKNFCNSTINLIRYLNIKIYCSWKSNSYKTFKILQHKFNNTTAALDTRVIYLNIT